MKISFPNWSLHGSSINRQVTWCIVSIICLLAGSYIVGRYLGLLVVLLLVVAGTVISRAVRARLNSNNSYQQETAPSWTDTPQITAGWDYRPRRAIRRRVDLHLAAETSEVLTPDRFVTNDDVWFNDAPLDDAAPGLLNDPPGAEEPLTSALSPATDPICTAPAVDDAAISRYDQSPIDERTAMAE